MIKILLFVLFVLSIGYVGLSASAPKISFSEILVESEANPISIKLAKEKAISRGLPINVLFMEVTMIDAMALENGNIVYAVITDFAKPYNGGYTAYYEEIVKIFDYAHSRIDYGNGNIVDNTNRFFIPISSSSSGLSQYLMIPDWTLDNVYLFNAQNGDLVDANFILSGIYIYHIVIRSDKLETDGFTDYKRMIFIK